VSEGLRTLWADEIERARSLVDEGVAAGHGAIVFVTGPAGSGRTAFLREVEGALRKPRVISGGSADGTYVPWVAEPGAFRRAMSDAEKAIGLAAAAVPVLGLVAQVATTSRAATDLIAPAAAAATPTFDKLGDVLRAAAREEPTVCIIDDCDKAPGQWWSQLLFGLVGEVNRDLPLFLFIAVTDEGDSDALMAAQDLRSTRAAELWELRTVEPAELGAVMGPAEPDVLGWLHDLSEGRVGWALELWTKWLGSEIVERPTDLAPWRFAPGQPAASPASILGVVRERIKRTVGGDASMREVGRMLACAALEGRYFTPEAVARAMFVETEEVLATLAPLSSLVEEAGAGRYRFASPLVRSALLRYGFDTPDERKRFDLKLAKGLERTHEGEVAAIASRLARLYEDAGKAEEAQRYREMSGSKMPAGVVVEAARAMLGQDTTDWSWARCRQGARLLLDAAQSLMGSGTFDEMIAFAALAASLARRARLPGEEARSLRLQGFAEIYAGLRGAAASHLDAAIAIERAEGNLEGLAEALSHKAFLDGLGRDLTAALAGLEETLGIWQKLDRPDRELSVHLLVANLGNRVRQSDLEEGALQAALALSAHASPAQKGVLLKWLAIQANKQDDPQAALTYYAQAAEQFEAIGHTRDAASARRGIAITLVRMGDDESARPLLEASIVAAQEMGNVMGEAEVRAALGLAERRAGNHLAADAHLRTCVRLSRELGDEQWVADAERELAASPLT
jgi:tetratricopeptide (TPR) repeat protein